MGFPLIFGGAATGTATVTGAAALTGLGTLTAGFPDAILPLTIPPGLGLEVGDRITVKETPPGFASSRTGDYVIQQISGQISPGPLSGMKLSFLLWPASVSSFWILDDPDQSLLGVSTRLGY